MDPLDARSTPWRDLCLFGIARLQRLEGRCLAAIDDGGEVESPDWPVLLGHVHELDAQGQVELVNHYCLQSLLALAACLAPLTSPAARLRLADLRFAVLSHLGLRDAAVAELEAAGIPGLGRALARALAEDRQFERAAALAGGNDALLAEIRELAMLDGLAAAEPQADPLPIHVVNLPRDRYRRRAVESRLGRLGLAFEVHRATALDELPEAAGDLWAVPGEAQDGSLANQVSQYRVWKHIRDGDAEAAIVLEDDAFVRTRALSGLVRAALDGRDIVFFNDRLCGRDRSTAPPTTRPLVDAFIERPGLGAPGADGYALTREGAAKLVAILEHEKIRRPGTDWLIVSHGLDEADLDAIPDGVGRKALHSYMRAPYRSPVRLRAAALTVPLAEHRPLGTWRGTRLAVLQQV